MVEASQHRTAAFQGEPGAYSEEAVGRLLPGAETLPCETFDDAFEALVAGRVERAVVPIENSLFGSVHVCYDLLAEHDVRIVGEGSLRIRHHLLAAPGTALGDVRRVLSHPQALGQCRRFVREHLPNAEPVPVHDTAGAARMVAEAGQPGDAAIASARAGAVYGLASLADGIETDHANYTRFLVLARHADADAIGLPEAAARTSLLYALHENVPGALFKSLAAFALREIDLLKIESRPLVGRPGRYRFYLDLAGRVDDPAVARALDHLDEMTDGVRVLGCYARAAPPDAT